jgi:hypothetical protein
MTESKFSSRNTHTDTIPVSETLIPFEKEEGEISKDEDIPHVESSGEFTRRVMTIFLGLFSMIVLVYPVLIIPGTIIVILPLEVAILDRIYGEVVQAKTLFDKHPDSKKVSDSISDSMEKGQIRSTVYGRRSPG